MAERVSDCLTCQLLARRDAGEAPLWDCIYRADYWDVVHSYNTSLPGWLVLVLRRHVEAIAELTEAEAVELGQLQRRASQVLHEATGCAKTYVVQFAEHPQHPHVHFHIIPIMADMPQDQRALNVFKLLGVPEEQRVSEAEMNRIAAPIKEVLIESIGH
jgi:diadenosine tetraphosphate (Ap4A) HIT family hydrolase